MLKSFWKLSSCFLLLAGLMLTGCGDTNLFSGMSSGSNGDTKMEKGLAYLDNGNWDAAISVFSSMPDSDDKRKYLSSAYIGKAGFDTLELITLIDEAHDAGSTGGTAIWQAVGGIFDSSNTGLISAADLDAKIAEIEDALSVLLTGATGNAATMYDTAIYDNMNEDRLFQAGIAAALHGVLVVSREMDADEAGAGLKVIDPVKYANWTADNLPAAVPAVFADDLTLLSTSLNNLTNVADNALVEDMNSFLQTQMNFTPGGTVDLTDLNAYILSLSNI